MNLRNLAQNFSDEDQARRFLERMRWPDGVVCPHCGVVGEAYRLEASPESKTPVRKGVWKCRGCQKQFTVTIGTIFEDSHIPLNKWLMAIHFMCASKKGMSSHQLHRMLGVTYKSAWFMTHRIRYAMTQESFFPFSGTVEVDETYIGGKERGNPGRPTPERSKKATVVSMVERSLIKGESRARSVVMDRVTAENLKPLLKETVENGTVLNTDEAVVYYYCRDDFSNHDVIRHKDKKYSIHVNGRRVSTNAVEGYFATLKRGIHGVYHHVGKQHLHRYLSEFDFRYNARKVKDHERTLLAIKGATGKRLKYRDTQPQIAEPF